MDDRIQPRRLLEVRRPQRHRAEVGEVFTGFSGYCTVKQIVIPGLRIDPITWRDHAVGGQRGNQAVHDFLGAQAQFAGALAINVQFEGRIIHVLRHEHVADSGQGAHLWAISVRDLHESPSCPCR